MIVIVHRDHWAAQKRSQQQAQLSDQILKYQKRACRKRFRHLVLKAGQKAMVSGLMLKKCQMLMLTVRDLMVARRLTGSEQDLQPDQRPVDQSLVLMADRRLTPDSLFQMRKGYWMLVVQKELGLELLVRPPPSAYPVGLDGYWRLPGCTEQHLQRRL